MIADNSELGRVQRSIEEWCSSHGVACLAGLVDLAGNTSTITLDEDVDLEQPSAGARVTRVLDRCADMGLRYVVVEALALEAETIEELGVDDSGDDGTPPDSTDDDGEDDSSGSLDDTTIAELRTHVDEPYTMTVYAVLNHGQFVIKWEEEASWAWPLSAVDEADHDEGRVESPRLSREEADRIRDQICALPEFPTAFAHNDVHDLTVRFLAEHEIAHSGGDLYTLSGDVAEYARTRLSIPVHLREGFVKALAADTKFQQHVTLRDRREDAVRLLQQQGSILPFSDLNDLIRSAAQLFDETLRPQQEALLANQAREMLESGTAKGIVADMLNLSVPKMNKLLVRYPAKV